MKLKCISLWQPWASAMMAGLKAIETRGYARSVRGVIGIHAAQKRTKELERWYIQLAASHPEILDKLNDVGLRDFKDLPFGAVLGTVNLYDCRPVEALVGLSQVECALGDYSAGRFGWMTKDLTVFPEPISAKGKQGFFYAEVPEALLREEKGNGQLAAQERSPTLNLGENRAATVSPNGGGDDQKQIMLV